MIFKSVPVHFADDGHEELLYLPDAQRPRRVGLLESVQPAELVCRALGSEFLVLSSICLALLVIVLFLNDILLMSHRFLGLVFHPRWCK